MHSEHLSNVHPGWVVGGWLVGVAVTSGAFLAVVGMGLASAHGPGTALAAALCMAVGFFAAGLFIGFRWTEAPILHGVALALTSVVVWFGANLLSPDPLGGAGRGLGSPRVVLGLILLQLVSAVGGGWLGRRTVLGGGEIPGPEA
jgi:hypothetical protein